MKKILIIDDEAALLKIFKMEFEELTDLEVHTALNGTEAIEKIKNINFDVLLTDLTMPKMGGVKFLNYLKEQDMEVECTLVISGLPKELHEEELANLNVAKYFEKPYRIMEIVNFVKSKCI